MEGSLCFRSGLTAFPGHWAPVVGLPRVLGQLSVGPAAPGLAVRRLLGLECRPHFTKGGISSERLLSLGELFPLCSSTESPGYLGRFSGILYPVPTLDSVKPEGKSWGQQRVALCLAPSGVYSVALVHAGFSLLWTIEAACLPLFPLELSTAVVSSLF